MKRYGANAGFSYEEQAEPEVSVTTTPAPAMSSIMVTTIATAAITVEPVSEEDSGVVSKENWKSRREKKKLEPMEVKE